MGMIRVGSISVEKREKERSLVLEVRVTAAIGCLEMTRLAIKCSLKAFYWSQIFLSMCLLTLIAPRYTASFRILVSYW
jgi:hypothetical protein